MFFVSVFYKQRINSVVGESEVLFGKRGVALQREAFAFSKNGGFARRLKDKHKGQRKNLRAFVLSPLPPFGGCPPKGGHFVNRTDTPCGLQKNN